MIAFRVLTLAATLFVGYASSILSSSSSPNYVELRTLSSNDENWKRSDLLDCIKHIANVFVFRTPIVLLREEVANLAWANLVLKAIEKPKIIVSERSEWKTRGFYILFPDGANAAAYKEIFRRKMYEKSKFVCVWNYAEAEANATEIRAIFEQFWYHQHIDVILLARYESALKVYTFAPYMEGKCGSVGDPRVIDVWRDGKFAYNYDLFSTNDKVRNLRGCPLKAIGNRQPPDNIMRFDGRNWSASGVANEVLRIAEEYLNFTSSIEAAELNVNPSHMWWYFYEELEYISETISRTDADFAFGWYSYASIEIDNLDVTMELGRVSSIDCFGWAVPYRAGARPPNWSYFTYEFKSITWSLIALTCVAAAYVFNRALRRSWTLSTLTACQILLEQPTVQRRSNAGFRVLFVNFCVYCMVISAAYKASFGSFITVSSHGKEFVSVYDILNSTLRVCGSPEMSKILNATSTETGMVKRVLKRFEVLEPGDFADVMSRLISERNIAIMGVKRSLYFYAMHEAKRLKVKIPFRFIPGCLLRPHTTHFMFRRGSHLIETFNVVLNRLFESGITQYWILHLGANRVSPVEQFKGRQLRMSILTGPIMVLLCGYVVSSCVFAIEIYTRKRRSTG